MTFSHHSVPFLHIGAAVMFIVLLWKWGLWLYRLPLADKKQFCSGCRRAVPSRRSGGRRQVAAHRRIFRSTRCWYMHMSLAFGWFSADRRGVDRDDRYLGFRYVPLQGMSSSSISPRGLEHKPVFDFPDGSAAAVRPLGRGAGLGQASFLEGWACGTRPNMSRATALRFQPVVRIPGA